MGDPAGGAQVAYLGLDVGSTATKAAALLADGSVVATARCGYPIRRPATGRAEQDADRWWEAADRCVAEIAGRTDLSRVRGIGITSQVDTHVLVDDAFAPLGPALLWQDIRAADDATALSAALGDDGLRDGWGTTRPITSSSPVSRALWLARHEPAAWSAARWMQLPKDHVVSRLTGAACTDPLSSFSVVGDDGTYVPGVAHAPGLAERLPPLRSPDHVAGTVRHGWHGVAAGTAVTTGTMDAVANVLGSGLHHPGDAMVVLGTSAIVAAVDGGGPGHPGVVGLGPLHGRMVQAGPTQAGGAALQWWADATGHTVDEVLAAAAAVDSSRGVVFAPHLLGERAPLWDSAVRAWFTGIDAGARFGHLSRAVLEGVAYSVRELLDAVVAATGVPTARVVVSGGGSRSALWCETVAAVLGVPVRCTVDRETAVTGAAALVAAATTGADPWSIAAELARLHPPIDPDPAAAARHSGRYAQYRDVYRLLDPVHQDMHREPGRD